MLPENQLKASRMFQRVLFGESFRYDEHELARHKSSFPLNGDVTTTVEISVRLSVSRRMYRKNAEKFCKVSHLQVCFDWKESPKAIESYESSNFPVTLP